MKDNAIVRLLTENVAPRAGRGAWHGGPTVVGALRGVSIEAAAWRPAAGRHSIWELALHIGYWHHIIVQRLRGGERAPFPRSPADWPAMPLRPTDNDWKRDRALVRATHLEVAATIRGIDPRTLGRRPVGNRKWTVGETILGAGQHEAYHTGQIQLLKRLWAASQ